MAKNERVSDGVIDVWFNAAKVAIHHPATPRSEHSHAFAAYTLAQEVKDLRAELQQYRAAAEPAGYHVIKECGKVGCSVATLEEAERTRDFWNKNWTIRPYFYAAPQVTSVDESAFEVWFKSVESGDDENWMEPKYLSREWNDYVARRQLALGAWRAAAAPAVQEAQEVKK